MINPVELTVSTGTDVVLPYVPGVVRESAIAVGLIALLGSVTIPLTVRLLSVVCAVADIDALTIVVPVILMAPTVVAPLRVVAPLTVSAPPIVVSNVV